MCSILHSHFIWLTNYCQTNHPFPANARTFTIFRLNCTKYLIFHFTQMVIFQRRNIIPFHPVSTVNSTLIVRGELTINTTHDDVTQPVSRNDAVGSEKHFLLIYNRDFPFDTHTLRDNHLLQVIIKTSSCTLLSLLCENTQ